jgi:mannose-6-phosphate isomerase-like protein (cupin superfamily)
MKRKVLSWLCVTALALSMTACAGGAEAPVAEVTESVPAPAPAPVPEPEPAPAEPGVTEVSVDFEDGNFSFVQPYLVPADAGNVELSVADFDGSKALAVKLVDGKVPYVGIDVSSLLGDKVADVKTIELTMGTSYDDGSFNATSGQITAWSGADLVQSSDTWSVFMENKNPKVAVAALDAGEEFIAGANNIIVVSLKDNAGLDAHGNPTLYLDNLRFLDGSGNLLTADTAVAFAAPAGYENTAKDMTHLAYLKNAVELDGFSVSADAWAQAGVDITPEVQGLLVPGSIVEIEYSSESGDIWLVITGAANGWIRVNDGNRSVKNLTKNIAQISYEDIMAACGGDDSAALTGQIQCESDTPWEVYSVKIGTDSGITPLKKTTELEGFAVSADAWAQAGIDITPEMQALLVPGAVVEVEYTSESGDVWLVVTGAANGWIRINDGGRSAHNGQIAQFTYEDIMAACGGDDATALTGQLQCESDTPWEVYSVKIGVPAGMVPLTNVVDLAGFAVKADAWSQAGIDLTPEVQALLVPGSVVEIEYTSESGEMWLVITGAANGWIRVNDNSTGNSHITGSVAQISYEDIMAACGGSDSSALTGQIQGESDTPWEIYRVGIGTAKVAE